MSWVTVIWSMVVAICLTMALPHVLITVRNPGNRVNVCFVMVACAVAGIGLVEFGIMHAATVEESVSVLRFAQLPIVVLDAALVGFVSFYFGTGRRWLGVLAVGFRAVGLVPNFFFQPTLAFREVTGLRYYSFLGEMLSRPVGLPSPWIVLAYLSSLTLLLFVVDASIRLWRRGSPDGRRRAVVIGGGIVLFVLVSQTCSGLINSGILAAPYLVSIPFLAVVAAMQFELTHDVARATELNRKLQASEERMSLAAESARLALWEWDVERDEVLMANRSRRLFGFADGERINFASLNERVHPDDRALRQAAVDRALQTGGIYEMEYRLLLPDGKIRWVSARGHARLMGDDQKPRIVGVSLDITREKLAGAEVERQRAELGHLARVALVGEMATSLAHELNQPLTAIVANAGAAQRFLARDELKVDELRDVLTDIAADGRRAGDVIRGIKGMVRKVEGRRTAVDLNEVTGNVLRLVRADALAHDCTIRTELAPGLPAVTGDAVQLQQVLLNLVINSFDAMRQSPGEVCAIEITTRAVEGAVELVVRDYGPGLPPDVPAKVFERFFSTKPEGMGMGLAIARSIIEAHQGILDAENAGVPGDPTTRGARFRFRLPLRVEPAGETQS
jgi:PAS domain S-box-containing protein